MEGIELMEALGLKKSFNGAISVQLLENGLVVMHYSPQHGRNLMRYFESGRELGEYVEGIRLSMQQKESVREDAN